MSKGFKQHKGELRSAEEQIKAIAGLIGSRMPPGWGFALLSFSLGPGGSMSYISNANREDMVFALREMADKLERQEDRPHGALYQEH